MRINGVVAREAAPDPPVARTSRLSALLRLAILVLLATLLVEVLFEGWLVILFGTRGVDANGFTVVESAGWPKVIKNSLYLGVFVLTTAKVTADRAWRGLMTTADLALAVLGVVMVVAGLLGGSSAALIGQALFVYFRAVIVWYAFRAVRPSWREGRPLLWIGGSLITLDVVIGIWQFLAGETAYTSLGWADHKWIAENRAQGLLDHPNNLGHLAALMLLGLLAWFVSVEQVKARWWALFVLVATGLSVAQSRQSLLAALAAIGIVASVRRGRSRAIVAAAVTVAVLGTMPIALSADNRNALAYRLGGLFNALQMSGDRGSRQECVDNPECQGTDAEIRILFVKQGVRLWEASPMLGYGVGQFGGIVAVKHDPQWHRDPRFQAVLGEGGFFRHGFRSTSVDVFWLHLLVEVGALGVIAYLVWLWFVGRPLWRQAWQRGGRSGRLRQPQGRDVTVILWSVATLVFAVLIASWSPAMEDPLFPPLMFGVLGFGWVLSRKEVSQLEGRT